MNRILIPTLMARLMGTSCSISVDGTGEVSNQGEALRVVGQGEAAPIGSVVEVKVEDAQPDPAAPQKELTPEEQAAKDAAAPEEGEKPAEEEANKDKPVVELSPEETAEIDGRADLNPVQKDSMKKYTIEMKTTGALSEESIADAAKVWNVPESMVRDYVKSITPAYEAALKAGEKPAETVEENVEKLTPEQIQAHQERLDGLYETAGGQANYDAFAKWAMDGGLTDAEILDITQSADISKAAGQRALAAYLPKFNAEGGAKGGPKVDLTRMTANERPQPEGVQGFRNRDEQNAALNKLSDSGRPLMEVDPTYRQSVEQRIAVTTFKVPGQKSAFM